MYERSWTRRQQSVEGVSNSHLSNCTFLFFIQLLFCCLSFPPWTTRKYFFPPKLTGGDASMCSIRVITVFREMKASFFLFPTEILADEEKVVGDAINSSIGKTRLDQQINNVKETTAGVCTFPPFGFFPISGLVAGSGHEASSDDWAQLEWLFLAEAVTVFLSKSEAFKTINRTVLKCLIGRAMSSLVNSLDFERL